MAKVATSPLDLSVHSLLGVVFGVSFPGSIVLFATGMCFQDFTVALVGVLALWASNMLYACLDVKNRLLLLFCHMGIALFLLSRPFVALFDPRRGWLLSSVETTNFALWAIFLALFFLCAGTAVYELMSKGNARWYRQKKGLFKKKIQPSPSVNPLIKVQKLSKSERIACIRTAALVCFLVCLVGSLILGYQKLSYMQGLRYEEYYLINVDEHSSWIITTLSVMTPYLLCAYLATLPKRRPTMICLVFYIITTIPMLIIGSRNDFVLAVLFSLLYFVLRNVIDDEKWIGRKEAIVILVGIPIGVFFMGLLTYVRAGGGTTPDGFIAQIVDAFYKQGVTFTVLGRGYDVNPQIQDLGFKFFTLGSLISNITQGFIGQTFLGFTDLGSINSAELALHGNAYAHTMSFFAHSNYLGGEGYGSSFVLEAYADFGYAGIAVISFLLGLCFAGLSRAIGKTWFMGMVALMSLFGAFHMARGSAMEWIEFIWSTRFWFAMAFLAVVFVCFVLLRGYTTKTAPSVKMSIATLPSLSGSTRSSMLDCISVAGLNENALECCNKYGMPVVGCQQPKRKRKRN
ncbi:MAG: O-antigen polysaccharide polymerase Wzy family protein [Raoultibacter sp.]